MPPRGRCAGGHQRPDPTAEARKNVLQFISKNATAIQNKKRQRIKEAHGRKNARRHPLARIQINTDAKLKGR
jgi:hypothetical protein